MQTKTKEAYKNEETEESPRHEAGGLPETIRLGKTLTGENLPGEVSLEEILLAREKRALKQADLVKEYQKTLISFTMNVAGPIKTSPDIRRIFEYGVCRIKAGLMREKTPVLYFEKTNAKTGDEAFFAVDAPPEKVKKITVFLEDEEETGRLFDIDVIDKDGVKISRTQIGKEERRCLICENKAFYCSRSRAHSVKELQEATRRIINSFLEKKDEQTIASNAVRALLYEMNVTPKPGLVDRFNNGSHRDMDTYTFIDSAVSLYPYFMKCASFGIKTRDTSADFEPEELRTEGIKAECDMLLATGGVNTHKGSVFSMGIMCMALARAGFYKWNDTDAVLNECAEIAKEITKNDFDVLKKEGAKTVGEKLFLEKNIKGARGEACNGFPAAKSAFGALEELLLGDEVSDGSKSLSCKHGKQECDTDPGSRAEYVPSYDEAGSVALLNAICAHTDTNMIARSNVKTASDETEKIKMLLKKNPSPSVSEIKALDTEFIDKNLSPGGSADMLALAFMLYFMKYGEERETI